MKNIDVNNLKDIANGDKTLLKLLEDAEALSSKVKTKGRTCLFFVFITSIMIGGGVATPYPQLFLSPIYIGLMASSLVVSFTLFISMVRAARKMNLVEHEVHCHLANKKKHHSNN